MRIPRALTALAAALAALAFAAPALAHAIGGKDAAFVAATRGPDPLPFLYLGAKHMVTGYDHLLFLVGVIFFLFRLRQVALYVSLFSHGHSITLLAGVFLKLRVDPSLVDAVIGLSVAWKAFDIAVNTGPRRAAILLQSALCRVGPPVAIDGEVGAATVAAVQAQARADEGLALVGRLRAEQADFYRRLVAHAPKLTPFLAGWLNRAAA